jgi:cytohesin
MQKLLACLLFAGNSERKIKMKTLITIITVVLLVGCGTIQTQKTVELPSVKAEAPDISILEAVFLGNLEVVKQHLAAGTDVNVKDEDKNTPLHIAAFVGTKEIVELLIAKGADVNAKEEGEGMTPLLAAIGEDRKIIVELLIVSGADINAQSEMGTPLHLATGFGHNEIAELLIDKGANINTMDVDGKTAIDLAVSEGKRETADLLRKHGGKTGAELKAEGK